MIRKKTFWNISFKPTASHMVLDPRKAKIQVLLAHKDLNLH